MELIITLPDEIVAKISDDIKQTSFSSVEFFIESLVLQKYPELREVEENEEKLNKRMRALGYLE
uniref:CopG family transcriptional regulator n=1 Tax=viral metagenome TaxID=1070528 RepID=A0A6M3ME65_9ZZZZ